MLVRAPLVETEQHGSILIQDLAKVVMARRRLGLTEERLVPFKAAGNVPDADDRLRAFHRIFRCRLNFDMSGSQQWAKPVVECPLDGRVRLFHSPKKTIAVRGNAWSAISVFFVGQTRKR